MAIKFNLIALWAALISSIILSVSTSFHMFLQLSQVFQTCVVQRIFLYDTDHLRKYDRSEDMFKVKTVRLYMPTGIGIFTVQFSVDDVVFSLTDCNV